MNIRGGTSFPQSLCSLRSRRASACPHVAPRAQGPCDAARLRFPQVARGAYPRHGRTPWVHLGPAVKTIHRARTRAHLVREVEFYVLRVALVEPRALAQRDEFRELVAVHAHTSIGREVKVRLNLTWRGVVCIGRNVDTERRRPVCRRWCDIQGANIVGCNKIMVRLRTGKGKQLERRTSVGCVNRSSASRSRSGNSAKERRDGNGDGRASVSTPKSSNGSRSGNSDGRVLWRRWRCRKYIIIKALRLRSNRGQVKNAMHSRSRGETVTKTSSSDDKLMCGEGGYASF